MLLLQLVGINMTDGAAETFAGGLRNYLKALGFIVTFTGAEFLREGGHCWVGTGLIVAGLPIFASVVIFQKEQHQ